MLNEAVSIGQASNFELKHVSVELMGVRTSERSHMALETLEAVRTNSASVPASKHSLETICGASCETGAQ